MLDDIYDDNNTIALYRNVASKLAELVVELEIHAARGSITAKHDLIVYRAMLTTMDMSRGAQK
jgi:hypothetical protein